jgi:hypothetical protein
MGAMAQNARDLFQYQTVSLPLQYATQVLDKNHTGLISIQQIAYQCNYRVCNMAFVALCVIKLGNKCS